MRRRSPRAVPRAGHAVLLGSVAALAPAGLGAQQAPAADPEAPSAVTGDAAGHHLFLAPTARTLPGGTGYAGLFAYLFPYVGYAFTDFFYLGGGAPLFSLFGDADRLLYFTPKLRVFRHHDVQAALGSLSVLWLDGRDARLEPGLVYGVATADVGRLGITGGAVVASDRWGGEAFFLGGLELGVLSGPGEDDGVKLMAEVLALPSSGRYYRDGGFSGALTVRFHDPRIAFDVSMVFVGEDDGVTFASLPLAGFTTVF